MNRGIWTPSELHNTRCHAYQEDTPEHENSFLIYQERTDERRPFLLSFKATLGSEQGTILGYNHNVRISLAYFDEDGKFAAAEKIAWLPRFGTCDSRRTETFTIDDVLREKLSGIPEGSISTDNAKALDDEELIKRVGVPYEQLFAHYQDPLVYAQLRESIMDELRKDPVRARVQLGEDMRFDTDELYCRVKYILAMVKSPTGFDFDEQLKLAVERETDNAVENLLGESLGGILSSLGGRVHVIHLSEDDLGTIDDNTLSGLNRRFESHDSPRPRREPMTGEVGPLRDRPDEDDISEQEAFGVDFGKVLLSLAGLDVSDYDVSAHGAGTIPLEHRFFSPGIGPQEGLPEPSRSGPDEIKEGIREEALESNLDLTRRAMEEGGLV